MVREMTAEEKAQAEADDENDAAAEAYGERIKERFELATVSLGYSLLATISSVLAEQEVTIDDMQDAIDIGGVETSFRETMRALAFGQCADVTLGDIAAISLSLGFDIDTDAIMRVDGPAVPADEMPPKGAH